MDSYTGEVKFLLIPGRIFTLIALLLTCAGILYRISLAKKGVLPALRRIRGLEAIEEGIGRATEIGSSVFFTTGMGGLTTASAVQTLAGLEVLSFVAETVARYKTNMIVAIAEPNVFPLAEEITRGAFSKAGHPDLYKEDMVRFLSPEQFAYAAACLGIMSREKVGTAIMMGEFQAESLLLAEGASQAGAISIAGCNRIAQIPFFVAACDYTLIGEELFAGGAYLSQDPIKLGSISGQDYAKMAAFVLIFVGALAMTFGSDIILKMLKW